MRVSGSIAGPLILILVGAVFLIHSISPEFRLPDLLTHYWPYLLIIWGVVSLAEIFVRFAGSGPMPRNGISGGGWALVVLVSLAGLTAFEVRRPDTWWRQVGFERGVEAFGEEHEYSIAAQQRAVGPAPHIVIENFKGDAKVTGAPGDELSLTGHKTVRAFEARDADKSDKQTPVEIVVEGNNIIIRCHQDRADSRSPVTTNLELSVPQGASLEATGERGDFDVTGLAGDVELSSGNSGMRLQDIGGNVKVDTHASDLIRCTGITGTVDLRGRGSDVELLKVAGQVTVAGDYSGTVSLRELAKPVRVESMRTQLEARGVPGEIRLERGSLNVSNVVGPVKLTAHSTDVTLDGFSDALDLNVDRGDVELRPEKTPLGRMAVHARSGNIELSVPESSKFALIASTDNGEVDNQFGETLKVSSEGKGAKLEGSVGSGPDVSLVTQHGSITVRKASGETAQMETAK